MAVLMLSQGVPMILAGDEVLRSQQGNNNSYCQDNALSWFDWNLLDKNQEMFCFTKGMIRLRKRHPCLKQRHYLTGTMTDVADMPDVTWHGQRLNKPQWADSSSRILGCTLSRVEPGEEDLHILLNMSENNLSMKLPELQGRKWYLAVDTSRTVSLDIIEPERQRVVRGKMIQVRSHSIVVCESR